MRLLNKSNTAEIHLTVIMQLKPVKVNLVLRLYLVDYIW